MCWSEAASTGLAAAGFIAAGTLALKKDAEAPALWLCLLYFALMETLQALSYPVVNQCDAPSNQMLTLLGYLHIAFQPFFINAVALHFLPPAAARKAAPWVYGACFAGTLSLLVQLQPMDWAGLCAAGRPLCGERLCTVSGEWHIAWLIPVNGLGNGIADIPLLGHGYPGYALTAFLVPVLAGSWRFALYTYLAGPLLASLSTDNINEWPAIWCLFSIGFLLLMLLPPLRRHLHVGDPWWMRVRSPLR